MVVAILSDIHANLPALEAFLKNVRGKAEGYVCLGDTVNYGPWNDECLEIVSSLPNVIVLEGNHEQLFLRPDAIEQELPIVQDFYGHSVRGFTRRDLIQDLPGSYRLDRFLCTHTIDNRKVYPDTDIRVFDDYIIGHTHRQFSIRRDGHEIVGCGSVGQNRTATDRIQYLLYDTCLGTFEFRDEPYPFTVFIRELRHRKYPQRCVDYYLARSSGG